MSEEAEAKTVNVVTTAPGVWGMQGIIPVGTKMEVPVEAFSAAWMKPDGIGASQRMKPVLEKRAAEAAARAEAKKKA